MSVLSGLLKGLVRFGKDFKSVQKAMDPVYKKILPEAVKSTAKPATGPRSLLKHVLPKDPAKTILKVSEPKPLSEGQKLGKTIEKFKQKYPKGLKIQENDQIKVPKVDSVKLKAAMMGGVAVSSTMAVMIAKNKTRK